MSNNTNNVKNRNHRKEEGIKPGLKYWQLMDTAERLIRRYGLNRVSVEEICREAGVSKMTFYKYFSNKIVLARAIIDKFMKEGEEEYRAIMDRNIPYEEKVKEIIRMKLDNSRDFSQELYNELFRSGIPELSELIQEYTRKNIGILISDIKKAQEMGTVRRDIKPEFIIFLLNQMIVMASDKGLLDSYDSFQDLIAELVNFFFYGILNREKSGEKK
jgi:AcrR family transcriptional regulator